ncbi:MAG: ABC transporter permease subunit [Oligoflexia bacterium]|nr:ABC transporter permease subunit [Oligoflexia bacterium]
MVRFEYAKKFPSLADALVFFIMGATIYAIATTSAQWQGTYQPITEIDLSLGSLPKYAFFSTIRGLVAYLISLTITLIFGYWAAKSKKAEKILVPLFDILQSIPPLGFLPALMLAMLTLFPQTNMGLELCAIILVVTSQAWNMIFSFYYSLKSLPEDYHQAADIMGLNWWKKLTKVEIPYAAVGLAWNSVISMANGWFFLSVCESFTLGERDYRLPGVGAYMAVAIKEGNVEAMIYGISTMVLIIVCLDMIIWRPILSWVRKFRVDEANEEIIAEPLMLLALKESRLIRFLKTFYRKYSKKNIILNYSPLQELSQLPLIKQIESQKNREKFFKLLEPVVWAACLVLVVFGSSKLIQVLSVVDAYTWGQLGLASFYTFLRVGFAVILSTLWAVPFGIWIGLSSKRTKIAQPIIQVLASFPAPMVYPLALKLFFNLGLNIDISSTFLMMLGVQWYVLFNVLAGALRISQNLSETLDMVPATKKDRWRLLYLPSIFPELVTGWVTATGGAWNASIVAEYIFYDGKTLTANGLGSMISVATAQGNTPVLAASLTLMIAIVVILNRTFWLKIYTFSDNKYRFD